MNYKYDIYVSYFRTDKKVADEICKFLSSNNISYWIDKNDHEPGESLSDEVVQAIKDSAILLFLASERSYYSPYCGKELSFFIKSDVLKNIVYLNIDGSTPPEAFYMLFGRYRKMLSYPDELNLLVQELK